MQIQKLREIVIEDYPYAHFVLVKRFLEIHALVGSGFQMNQANHAVTHLNRDNTNFICYILEPGTCGAAPGECCNGIRFGFDGDYISLPHLPESYY